MTGPLISRPEHSRVICVEKERRGGNWMRRDCALVQAVLTCIGGRLGPSRVRSAPEMYVDGKLVMPLGLLAANFDTLGHSSHASNCSVGHAVRCR